MLFYRRSFLILNEINNSHFSLKVAVLSAYNSMNDLSSAQKRFQPTIAKALLPSAMERALEKKEYDVGFVLSDFGRETLKVNNLRNRD